MVVDDGVVVAAAVRTLVKLAISREDTPGAIAVIARDAIHDPSLRAVLGPVESLRAFADASGRDWRSVHGTTIYECRGVVGSEQARDTRRVAVGADRTLVARWVEEFVAEALVADLTRDQLDRGRAFVYLYADRTNPTSNSIYQKIGYRRVAESDELWLE